MNGRTQVTCPECGAIGATEHPCWCHKCNAIHVKTLMQPSNNGEIISNWLEYFRFNKLPTPGYGLLVHHC